MSSNDTHRTLISLEDSRDATLSLIGSIRRSLCFYTPHLEPRLYNDDRVIAALRTRVTKQTRLRCKIILPPAAIWRRTCPQFLSLVERIPSALALRTLPPTEPRERSEFGQSFMIADDSFLLLLSDPYRCSGSYDEQTTSKARVLLGFFTEIWEKSAPDPNLRRLGI